MHTNNKQQMFKQSLRRIIHFSFYKDNSPFHHLPPSTDKWSIAIPTDYRYLYSFTNIIHSDDYIFCELVFP